MRNSLLRLFGVGVLAFALSGCGIIDYIYLPPPEDTAQELFEAGNDAMREKNYVAASGYYSKLKDNFPFSPYVTEAELALADAYFLDEEWGMAAEAYKEFESLHPRHEAIPYVLFQAGMAHLNGYPSIDRPITQIEDGYAFFRRVTESYPDSEYAPAAKEKMAVCRKIMAEHELYFADFYYRMGKYGSALSRYKDIVAHFSDVPEIHAHAVEKSKSAFIEDRKQRGESTRETREGTWKNMFNWL